MEHYSNVVKAMIARSNARAADIADKIQARAYYQFQYVPPAGPLPGWSMEQQTEDAINEIGNLAYSSDEIAREAREIAQQAYNAAQAAIEMATNAITAAQNAQQTADTALNTAKTAVIKADNAQASADAAQQAADAAQKSANDAQTAADNAQSTADTAIENASQALSAANEAKVSADQSNQRLDVLEPIVDTLQENLGSAEGDITAVTNALDAHKADYDNPHKVTAAQLGLATVYKYKGSVETYAALPTSGQQVGDVYNVKQADPDHNIEAGDNVAWDGTTWDILAGDTDLSGYAQLNSANTFTAANTFNSNIVVRAATAAGSAGVITLGKKPSSKTAQCLINAAGNGNLILQASENGIVALQSGSVLQWSVISDEANKKTSAYLHSNLAATYTPATGVVWEGNAKTATKLAAARTINGVPFDGTQNITIEAGQGTFLPLTGGTVTGPIYLPSATPTTDTQAVTKKYVDDSVAGAAAVLKTKFTASSANWGKLSDGYYPFTLAASGKHFLGMYRTNGSTYKSVMVDVVESGSNIIIQSTEKFAGFILTI